MHALTYTLLFEDHKNVWIFQKPLHSTIAMCEGGAVSAQHSFNIMSRVVEVNEPDAVRKQKTIKVLQSFFAPDNKPEDFPAHTLDMRSRDKF